jgi:hypothetical protein
MNNNIKNIIMCILFVSVIAGFFVSGILIPDNELSYSERRTLKKMPELTAEGLLSGEFFKGFEEYAPDHFPIRDSLRTIKAISHFHIFNMKDNNGIFVIENSAFKLLYPLNERSVKGAADKLNSVFDTYLDGMRVYYSIIPDKNYYSAKKHGYPVIDYDRLKDLMLNNTKSMEYIDIFDCLNESSYYKTDPHWRQEELGKVVARLADRMDFVFLPIDSYEKKTLYPFLGGFFRQSALPLMPDTLTYMTNDTIHSAIVSDFNKPNEKLSVYETDLFGKMDSYDIFLGGATPITVIENTKASSEKELILFRDSSGSSLAPLLLEGYKKITLIDLRYISSGLLDRFIDFGDQDVLFMYNIDVLNNSMMLK